MPLAEEMMADLDKETVDFVPNYDETTEEPTVLPAPFPNLLVNGSVGIAVGMATNIPPHNLREVVDAAIWLIEQREAADRRRPRRTRSSRPAQDGARPGLPDRRRHRRADGDRAGLPHGARVDHLRARATMEENAKGDRTSIVVTEIPYQVNKAKLIEKIAELVREKTLEGISDLRDESDREGLRIVIELKRGEVADVVLNNLYKHTPLQTTFGIIMLAIVGGRPVVLPLADLLRALHRVPARRGAAADRVRAAEGRGAGPHPGRPEDRPRPPGRGDRADPGGEVAAGGARGPDGELRPVAGPVAGHPRHAAAAPDRPGAAEDPRRAGRGAPADRAVPRHPGQRAAADGDRGVRAAGGPGQVRRRAADRDRRRRRGSSGSRT